MRRRGLSIAGLLKANNKSEAQGRLGQRVPIAIIDIGSNSVRQVIYEGLTRSPSVLFNEKVLCGLGKGVAKNGMLDRAASQRALLAIRRFLKLGEQLRVGETHVLATAATREAGNGEAFIGEVEALTGSKIQLLSGRMEAEYAALGIKAGFYKPEGITGDLGGGSMELIEVNGDTTNGVTTPLGSLRLQEMARNDLKAARNIAQKTLKSTAINWPGQSSTFYAVGGTWRSLARLYMLETGHPIEVVHGFSVPSKAFVPFCRKVASNAIQDFEHIDDISKNRRPLLPYGAVVMAEVLEHLGATEVAMSAVGLREGYLYSLLDEETREQDALLEATAELSILRARSPAHGRELAEWTDRAFQTVGITETENQRRWRIAACNLADIAWRSASDFRAEQTLGIINNAGFNSISHQGRAFLYLVTLHRYQGLGSKNLNQKIAKLTGAENNKIARVLAAFFRVLYLFSAAVEGVLPQLELRRNKDGALVLIVPEALMDMVGEKPESRMDALARELDEEITVVIGN
ncbi:MAG: Ppx/GppA phosphatase family protein [Pseudomonadota bacterium]